MLLVKSLKLTLLIGKDVESPFFWVAFNLLFNILLIHIPINLIKVYYIFTCYLIYDIVNIYYLVNVYRIGFRSSFLNRMAVSCESEVSWDRWIEGLHTEKDKYTDMEQSLTKTICPCHHHHHLCNYV